MNKIRILDYAVDVQYNPTSHKTKQKMEGVSIRVEKNDPTKQKLFHNKNTGKRTINEIYKIM